MPKPAPTPAPKPERSPIDSAEALGIRPVGRLLWHTCSQTTLSVSAYGIYALTNAWFVSRGVGEEALAAVNLVAPLLLFAGAVSTTVGVGGASLVSRALGARRPKEAARAAGNAFVVFWGAAVLITINGLLNLDRVLAALGASGAPLEYARPYAAILIAGAIFATGFSAIVRAEGRLFFSTMLWIIPVLVQIVLDPVLIFGLKMGTAGAALGTVGGQAVSAVMALWFFFVQKGRPYRVVWAALRPHAPTIGKVLSIGAPSFLAGLGATVLVVLVNVNLAAAGAVAGTVALAAFAVASRVQTFVTMPQMGITQGVQPIVGYNAGRGFGERVDRARTLALRATVICGLATGALIALTAPAIVSLFVSTPDIHQAATVALRVIAIGFAFSGVPPLISAYFQSLGYAGPSYAISIGTLALIKIPLVVGLATMGTMGIWISLPLGEALSALAALATLRLARRPRKSPAPPS